MIYNRILHRLEEEYEEATQRFAPFRSAHEGLAVVQEEFEELKAEVFASKEEFNRDKMRDEAFHLAAMAIRFITDITEI